MNEDRKKKLHSILNNFGNPKEEQDLFLDGIKELRERFVNANQAVVKNKEQVVNQIEAMRNKHKNK